MPVFRDCSQANRTSENGLLVGEGGTVPPFLRRAHTQSGFNKGRQANAMRSETDDAAKSGASFFCPHFDPVSKRYYREDSGNTARRIGMPISGLESAAEDVEHPV